MRSRPDGQLGAGADGADFRGDEDLIGVRRWQLDLADFGLVRLEDDDLACAHGGLECKVGGGEVDFTLWVQAAAVPIIKFPSSLRCDGSGGSTSGKPFVNLIASPSVSFGWLCHHTEISSIMRTPPTLALGILLGIAAVAAEPASERLDNWPAWRGPLANGTAPKGYPPVKWDAKTNVKWKTPLLGHGSSPPVVWGDTVFVLTALDTGREAAAADLPKDAAKGDKKTTAPKTYHQFIVLCLDRQTGKIRWQKTAVEKVPHEGHHPTHSYAAGSPTTDGRLLYASFGSFGLYCYDFEGNLKWKQDFGRMNTRLGWGEAVTPTLHGDTLLVNWDQESGSFITALDAQTGKQHWKVDRDELTTWNTPLVVEHKGRIQVIVNGRKRVRSYDLKTGELIWECGGQTVNPIPSPVVLDQAVICMSGYQGSAAYAISLDAQGDVTGKS